LPRVVGIDPGTVSIDICGLADGELFLDRTLPTAQALANPASIIDLLQSAGPLDLIAGPSGYGLPLTPIADVTDEVLHLAYLAPPRESGGIGGLRALAWALRDARLPVVFTPGTVHLTSVPMHRKLNRVDMGTADKVCAAALAIFDQATRRRSRVNECSLILLELGGAFTAALAVDGGRIVDGFGGSAGPLGLLSPGALDGEVAFLAGHVDKAMLFSGGAATVWGDPLLTPDRFAEPRSPRERMAWEALIEAAVKAVAALTVPVPAAREILLSGRLARVEAIDRELRRRLSPFGEVRRLNGFASVAKEAAQGAALIADGLAGGAHSALTDTMGLREAHGTVLDYLYVISPSSAGRRLERP